MALTCGLTGPCMRWSLSHRATPANVTWEPVRRPRRARLLTVHASWSLGVPEELPPSETGTSATDCPLLQYAHKVSMEEVAAFDAWAPLAVQHALRTTVNNLVGNLPSSSFDVIIRTSAPKMALLLFSTLMTGYMYHGAWQRLCLNERLGAGSPIVAPHHRTLMDSVHSMDDDEYRPPGGEGSPAAPGAGPDPGYARGSQQLGVTGEVLRWHLAAGRESMPASEYIRQLEREVEQHRAAAAAAPRSPPGHELLDFVRRADGALTGQASPAALQAMTGVVQRSMGESGGRGGSWRSGTRDCVAAELAEQLYWLAIVGWQLRALEFDARRGAADAGGEESAERP
ncbi:hypothetical protein ACKKBG_A22770 [Auxenochlorella protothecoides x Auxenochlorella symbiontica]